MASFVKIHSFAVNCFDSCRCGPSHFREEPDYASRKQQLQKLNTDFQFASLPLDLGDG